MVDRNPSKCIVNYTLNGNAAALLVNKMVNKNKNLVYLSLKVQIKAIRSINLRIPAISTK
jgi:hypothetical protein